MKTLAELQAIRDKLKADMENRLTDNADSLVIVGMATCGIAAGARAVLTAFMNEVAANNVSGVRISQTGCIGMCRLEPIVEVVTPDGNRTTYVKMTAEKAARVVREHIMRGHPVLEYTVSR